LEELPASYLYGNRPEQVASDLQKLKRLGRQDVIAEARYLPESNTTEYWIGTYEDIAPGVFHRLTGALSAEGLQILSAEINTLADGLIVDRFYVQDPDYAGEPRNRDRRRAVRRAEAPRPSADEGPNFRKTWGQRAGLRRAEADAHQPTTTSDHFTVLTSAADRRGLLYTIARTLYDMELSIAAKIGTYVDQVVDVFTTDRKERRSPRPRR
jgi:[protein-PII] uridylyltransferase